MLSSHWTALIGHACMWMHMLCLQSSPWVSHLHWAVKARPAPAATECTVPISQLQEHHKRVMLHAEEVVGLSARHGTA